MGSTGGFEVLVSAHDASLEVETAVSSIDRGSRIELFWSNRRIQALSECSLVMIVISQRIG